MIIMVNMKFSILEIDSKILFLKKSGKKFSPDFFQYLGAECHAALGNPNFNNIFLILIRLLIY